MKADKKMKTFGKKRSGFTIIELMIVILIVAVLVALAYPSYIQYVRKAKRGEAQQLLLNRSVEHEILVQLWELQLRYMIICGSFMLKLEKQSVLIAEK